MAAVKVLVCGNVGGKWEILLSRLNALQNSNSGPFHVLFIIGQAFLNENEFNKVTDALEIPLPIYLFNEQGIPASSLSCLPNNLHLINPDGNEGIGLATIFNLTVAYCKENVFNYSKDLAVATSIAKSLGYRGCDLFLSTEWPSDVHQFLDSELLISSNVSFGPSSPDVSSLAMLVRPRYHFAIGKEQYFQRPPYVNKVVDDKPTPCSRFIGLAAVNESKEKDKKWLHALSLQPITHMSKEDVLEVPIGSTECPYIPLGPIAGSKRLLSSPPDRESGNGKLARGPSDQSVTRNSRFDSLDISPPVQGAFFFGQMGVDRKVGAGAGVLPTAANIVTKPPSDTIKTLFIGGLSRETTESDIMHCLPSAVRVSRPDGKSFAFVDFSSHEAAKSVIESSTKQSLTINRRSVSVGWGKEPSVPLGRQREEMLLAKIDLEPPNEESTTLFLGGLPPAFLQEELLALFPDSESGGLHPVLGKGFCFLDMRSHESAQLAVKHAQTADGPSLRGYKLLVGWAKGDSNLSERDKTESSRTADFIVQTEPTSADATTLFVGNLTSSITAEDIQSLLADAVVHRPAGKSYSFIDFPSHSSATAGLNKLEKALVKGVSLRVGWAKGRSVGRDSHAEECWFCLGSVAVKAHLILSVGESCYLAAPRGSIVPDHTLMIPIDCVPNRLLLSAEAKEELSRFENAFRLFAESTGRDYLLFERTLRTRGRDHMQVQIVPLDETSVIKSLDAFLQLSSRHNVLFTEIPEEQDLDKSLLSPDGNPYQEYFFIQVPVRDKIRRYRRFLYVPQVSGDAASLPRFPLSFGLEVAAEALGKPERANWKSCLVSEVEEERMADSFKSKFTSFDFTLS